MRSVDDPSRRLTLALERETMNVVLLIDAAGMILAANAATREVLGWEPEELVNRSSIELVHPEDLVRTAEMMNYEQDHPGPRALRKISLHTRARMKNGDYRWVEPTGTNLLDDPDVRAVVLVLADATSRHQLDHVYELLAAGAPLTELAEAIVRLVEVEHWAVEAIVLDDADGRPLSSFGSYAGRSDPGHGVDIKAPDGVALGGLRMWLREGAVPTVYEREGFDRAAAIAGLALQRARTEAALREAARTDPLTRLANRTAFAEALEAVRHPERAAICIFDLDGFKAVNDELGHAGGDEVLIVAAHRLQASVAEAGFVCRLGGDEFAAVLEGLDQAGAEGVAESALAALRAPIGASESTVMLGASIGLCVPLPERDRDRALQRADEALYRAKRLGRNRVVVVSPGDG